MENFRFNRIGTVDCDIKIKGMTGMHPTTLSAEKSDSVIDSGVEIAPYIEPVKTLEQLQQEALLAISSLIIAECQSGIGKLYFSGLDSAARHVLAEVQPDAEIRARASQLLRWDVAIDNYCDGVLFGISEGGSIPKMEDFIAGLPKP